MTKEELIKKLNNYGIKPSYLPKSYIFDKEIKNDNDHIQLIINFDEDLKFDNIELCAFTKYIKTTDVEETKKIYDLFINDILEIKKVHLELLESINSDK